MQVDRRERSTPAALAYLVSEYPHIRHAYLLREIRGLRKLVARSG